MLKRLQPFKINVFRRNFGAALHFKRTSGFLHCQFLQVRFLKRIMSNKFCKWEDEHCKGVQAWTDNKLNIKKLWIGGRWILPKCLVECGYIAMSQKIENSTQLWIWDKLYSVINLVETVIFKRKRSEDALVYGPKHGSTLVQIYLEKCKNSGLRYKAKF